MSQEISDDANEPDVQFEAVTVGEKEMLKHRERLNRMLQRSRLELSKTTSTHWEAQRDGTFLGRTIYLEGHEECLQRYVKAIDELRDFDEKLRTVSAR